MNVNCRRIAALVVAGLLALPLAALATTNPSDVGIADDSNAPASERNVPTGDEAEFSTPEFGMQKAHGGVTAPGCGNLFGYVMSSPPDCSLVPNCINASTTGGARGFRDGVLSGCATEKLCPGNFASAATLSFNIYHYTAADCTCITVTQLQLQNPGPPVVTQPGCITAQGIMLQAYIGHVTGIPATGMPANCALPGATRFAGESGAGLLFNPRTFSFSLRPGETEYTLIVSTSAGIGAQTCVGTVTTTCGPAPSLVCALRPINDAIAAAEAKLDLLVLLHGNPTSAATLGGGRR